MIVINVNCILWFAGAFMLFYVKTLIVWFFVFGLITGENYIALFKSTSEVSIQYAHDMSRDMFMFFNSTKSLQYHIYVIISETKK